MIIGYNPGYLNGLTITAHANTERKMPIVHGTVDLDSDLRPILTFTQLARQEDSAELVRYYKQAIMHEFNRMFVCLLIDYEGNGELDRLVDVGTGNRKQWMLVPSLK